MCFIRSFHLYNSKIIEKTSNNTCSLMPLWAHAPLECYYCVHNSKIRFQRLVTATIQIYNSILIKGLLVHAPALMTYYINLLQRGPHETVISYLTTYHLDNLAANSNNSYSLHLKINHIQIIFLYLHTTYSTKSIFQKLSLTMYFISVNAHAEPA